MDPGVTFALAFGIGVVAGLRSLTAPAAVAWAAYLGWLPLSGTPLAFMGSVAAVAIFSLLALVEFVGDVLPTTPSRTSAIPLTARVLMGALSGACLAARVSVAIGTLLGAIGGVVGAFAGYQARTRLVKALGVKDIFIAIAEDLVAIGSALLLVSRG